MEPTDKDHSTARRRVCTFYTTLLSPLSLMFNQALARDGYQCMISCMFDRESLEHCSALWAIAERDQVPSSAVQTSHIFEEPKTQGIDPAGTDEDSTAVNNVRLY